MILSVTLSVGRDIAWIDLYSSDSEMLREIGPVAATDLSLIATDDDKQDGTKFDFYYSEFADSLEVLNEFQPPDHFNIALEIAESFARVLALVNWKPAYLFEPSAN